MYHKVNDPPQWLLDGLLAEERRYASCPDCGVMIGSEHLPDCDIPICQTTGKQRIGCRCSKCESSRWDGIWPGVRKAYDAKLVCFDDMNGQLVFDLNAVAVMSSKG